MVLVRLSGKSRGLIKSTAIIVIIKIRPRKLGLSLTKSALEVAPIETAGSIEVFATVEAKVCIVMIIMVVVSLSVMLVVSFGSTP